ncbi:hypothetical protein [Massilia sp. CFBP9026]|uniref:hypothetical protein n=1 Tax=Massilia sp. CFBP9026 TaxID=3096536 RepID=UPI002A6A59D0|nr:hypothetical protein [Massilia sp. CFBP9026]MDY0965413.1 hypothetical protein [Massilia sp. CFBP9026]
MKLDVHFPGNKLTVWQNERATEALCSLVANNALGISPAAAAEELSKAILLLNGQTVRE